jgi:glycosyltransferase involved in cell wall biosynthesis
MSDSPKVLIVATHPIQYHTPWFQSLAQQPDLRLEVLFLSILDAKQQGTGFGIAFEWDIPLLAGYEWSDAKKWLHSTGQKGFLANYLNHPIDLLKQLQPDVVLLTGWQVLPLLQILGACKVLKIPCIVRGESNNLKPRSLWVRLIHRQLLKHYDAFLAIGRGNHLFYTENGISIDRIFACPYFIDNQRFALAANELRPQREILRDRWKIPSDAICFCYVGKLEPKKRIIDLLAALRLLADRTTHLSIHLLVVGTGELMNEAKTFVDKYQLPVTFAGFLNQSEIPQAYVASDCLILPSDYGETWGLVVNEAMACGLPAIVSSHVGCAQDLIEPGVNGLVFPAGDITALANCLQQAFVDRSQLSRWGIASHQKIQQYSYTQTSEGLLNALKYLELGINKRIQG